MAIPQNSDALLIKNYIAGDENALALLIKKYQSRIYGFIYSKIADRDLVDDIFQDTFMKVIKTLKSQSYNEEGKFLPWVMRIASNLIIDHYRKNKRMNEQVENDLRKIIERLPDDQKEVLIMRIYQDLSFKEISEVTGVSINTALGRMRYALANIRKVVEKNQIILTN
jgi:RNA polymerase sigma-70 factor (ECF subfamily)